MPVKRRIYELLITKGLAGNRSQVETLVKLGKIRVNQHIVSSPNSIATDEDSIEVIGDRYVSRAAYKLLSVANKFDLDFKGKTVLDVGSSTGGFTDFALQHGAAKVIAVDVGTDQMVSQLRQDSRLELHEKTDIRKFNTTEHMDIVLVDVSFISLREILPYISNLMTLHSQLVAMAKPQFESGPLAKHKGVVKNDKLRRKILQDLENWIQKLFKIVDKADSEISGEKGNIERFYLLTKLELIRK